MINIENLKSVCEVLGERYFEQVCDPTLRLQDHTIHSCPGTAFTKLMVECMRREPQFPYGER